MLRQQGCEIVLLPGNKGLGRKRFEGSKTRAFSIAPIKDGAEIDTTS